MVPILTTDKIIADPFGERLAPRRIRMRVLGADFRFATDRGDALRLLMDTFGNLPRHRLSTVVPVIDVRIRGTSGGRQLRRGVVPAPRYAAGAGLICGAIDAHDYAALSPASQSGLVAVSRHLLNRPNYASGELLEFAVCTLASRVQGLIPLHAACVAHLRQGLLLMGESGAGKTTLAVQCLIDGFHFLSEDSCFVHPITGFATGLANYVYVKPSTLRYLPKHQAARFRRGSVPIRRRSGVAKLRVDLRELGVHLAPSPCRVAAVVFLSTRPAGKGPLLRSVSAREALKRCERLQPYAAGLPGWEQFARHVHKLQSWELRRDVHPRAGAEALRELTTAKSYG